MPTHSTIPYDHGVFSITFTCAGRLPLIEQVNGYDLVYNWFDILKGTSKNPCSGKWSLAASPIKYIHSSAYFYNTGVQGVYPVLNYREVVDMVFNKK